MKTFHLPKNAFSALKDFSCQMVFQYELSYNNLPKGLKIIKPNEKLPQSYSVHDKSISTDICSLPKNRSHFVYTLKKKTSVKNNVLFIFDASIFMRVFSVTVNEKWLKNKQTNTENSVVPGSGLCSVIYCFFFILSLL